jgi:hypothetical protein
MREAARLETSKNEDTLAKAKGVPMRCPIISDSEVKRVKTPK